MSFFALVTFSSEPPAVIQISPPATIKIKKITPTKEIIVVITVPMRAEIGVLERPVPSTVLPRPSRMEGGVEVEAAGASAGGVAVTAKVVAPCKRKITAKVARTLKIFENRFIFFRFKSIPFYNGAGFSARPF